MKFAHLHLIICSVDITLENILCSTNLCTDIKLIDFSMAFQINPDEKLENSRSYSVSSDDWDGKMVGLDADMWAIGDISYFL